MSNQQGFYPSGFFIVSFAAILSFIAFAGVKMFLYFQKMQTNEAFETFTGFTTILFGILLSMFILRKRDTHLTFGKAFVIGWMTTLLLGALTALFYYFAFKFITQAQMPENIIPTVLLKYNAFGMLVAAVLALMFKKN